MSGEQVAMRLLGSVARVMPAQDPYRADGRGRLEQGYEGLEKLQNANIFIDDSGALNPLELRARARRLTVAAAIWA
jgi:replicative DNA helicase